MARRARSPARLAGRRPGGARSRSTRAERHRRYRPTRDPLAGVAPTPPRDQYIQALRADGRLFVSGHDPEREGRLAYVGRVDQSVSRRQARMALRLATQNALVSARATVGPLGRYRCVVLTAFVATGSPEGLDPALLEESLALLAAVLPGSAPPAIWLRPAQGLAGGMPVEVELLLEPRPGRGGGPRSISRRSPRRR